MKGYKMKCKNCGHEIAYVRGQWFHVSEDEDGIYLTKDCEYSLKDQDEWIGMQEEELNDRVRAKYGNYEARTWFFEIFCACHNPEPEGEEK